VPRESICKKIVAIITTEKPAPNTSLILTAFSTVSINLIKHQSGLIMIASSHKNSFFAECKGHNTSKWVLQSKIRRNAKNLDQSFLSFLA